MNRFLAGLALALALAGPAAADTDAAYKALKSAMPGISKSDISKTPVDGIYEVQRGLSFFYVTQDGRYVFSGDMVDVRSGTSLTENSRKALRLDALNDLGDQSMITFPAKDEKYVLTVFTDIDCGYCRKLHREMGDYNDRGITVRYLFYPRSGPDTPSFDKAESVWCSKDQNDAMTQAKMGANVSAKACENPVQAHYEAGQRLGVRGTPALIMPDGSVQPGYLPADRLLTLLERS